MASLGLFLLWAGYAEGIFGWSKIKVGANASPKLTLSDCILPSHRATYMAAALAWKAPSTSVSPAAQASAAQANINAISKAQDQANKPDLGSLGTGIVPGMTPLPIPGH